MNRYIVNLGVRSGEFETVISEIIQAESEEEARELAEKLKTFYNYRDWYSARDIAYYKVSGIKLLEREEGRSKEEIEKNYNKALEKADKEEINELG